ncbi:hypothetical protein AB5N19_02294 [Seiridium cardinale]|uniref:Uncharacterized protein n=1 Tax=Seiridium cardinale TaxID=138064 RepID=A0ABR2XU89_9PEZI
MTYGPYGIEVNMDSPSIGPLEDEPLTYEKYDNEAALTSKKRPPSRRSTAVHIILYLLAAWGFISLWLQIFLSVFPRSAKNESTSTFPTISLDVYHPETLPDGMTLCDCGSDTQEALSRSCVYDTLATAWLPPYCRDAELTVQFDQSGDGPDGSWSYFADSEGTQPLAVSELGGLGDTGVRFWASRRWHRAHCLFYWQKLYRMRETGLVMEERFHRWSHVQHCTRLMLNPAIDLDVLVDVPVTMNSSIYAGRKVMPQQ